MSTTGKQTRVILGTLKHDALSPKADAFGRNATIYTLSTKSCKIQKLGETLSYEKPWKTKIKDGRKTMTSAVKYMTEQSLTSYSSLLLIMESIHVVNAWDKR